MPVDVLTRFDSIYCTIDPLRAIIANRRASYHPLTELSRSLFLDAELALFLARSPICRLQSLSRWTTWQNEVHPSKDPKQSDKATTMPYFYEERTCRSSDIHLCIQCDEEVTKHSMKECGQCQDILCMTCTHQLDCHMCLEKEANPSTQGTKLKTQSDCLPPLPVVPTCCQACLHHCEHCHRNFHSLCYEHHIQHCQAAVNKSTADSIQHSEEEKKTDDDDVEVDDDDDDDHDDERSISTKQQDELARADSVIRSKQRVVKKLRAKLEKIEDYLQDAEEELADAKAEKVILEGNLLKAQRQRRRQEREKSRKQGFRNGQKYPNGNGKRNQGRVLQEMSEPNIPQPNLDFSGEKIINQHQVRVASCKMYHRPKDFADIHQ